ncbi:putative transporter small subunit [Achromobacter sp. F4_2707]
MNTTILTIYVLMWPVMSALVLLALVRGVWKDIRRAKRKGEHLV